MSIWTGVITEHVQASKDFYTKYFAAEVIYEGEDSWFLLLKIGHNELGFMKPKQASQETIFQAPFAGHGVWLALEVDDATSEFQRLSAMNAPIVVPLKDEPWGDRHFALKDPNGIGVDVVQRIAP